MPRLLTLVLVAMTVLLAPVACAHPIAPKPGQLELGMVTDIGGLGDKSFNDSAYRGLLEARQKLDAYIQVLQSRSAADYQPNLIALSGGRFGMVYAIGFLMSRDLDDVAKGNPNQHFAIIDAVVDEPNVISVTFKEQDGSFLAGALAAMVSKTHHIAFMGGQDIPLLRKFEAGYIAGAREVDPNIHVDVKYIGSFDDVAAGKEIAGVLFSSGDDIIYAAAGKAGLGVMDEVKNYKHAFVIGVDSNQDDLVPGKVLTSMVKRVDVGVFDVAKAISLHRPLQGHLELGLKDGAVGLTNFKYTRQDIGSANLAHLDAIRHAIIDGRITPPKTREELATFTPVKL